MELTIILGHGLVWWTGMFGGFFFLLLGITALIKQYNYNLFIRWQVPFTSLHHWFGWLSVGFLVIHFILGLFSSVFGILF